MTYIKHPGPPMWLWLRWISERVWRRDWPGDALTWRSIIEE